MKSTVTFTLRSGSHVEKRTFDTGYTHEKQDVKYAYKLIDDDKKWRLLKNDLADMIILANSMKKNGRRKRRNRT